MPSPNAVSYCVALADTTSANDDGYSAVRAKILAELDQSERLDLSRDEMARRLNVSARSLSRHLQEEGCCWRELLSDYRIQRARHLLATRTDSLDQIAECVGYAGASALSNAFQRRFGLSPSRFRRHTSLQHLEIKKGHCNQAVPNS
jgi:AraC-like DNA-binding protein